MKASDILKIAQGEVGVRESPAGSNRVKYNTWYYGREVSGSAYPWCMAFVQWVFHQAGEKLPLKTASCTALMNYAKQAGKWHESGFMPGDIVLYNFDSDRSSEHVGIVEEATAGAVTAIEGNTSLTSDDNGGKVMRRYRKNNLILGVYRPDYEMEDETMTYETFKEYMDQYMTELKAQKPSGWSAEERAWAEETGLIQGSDNGDKQYKAFCTREQMVTFLYRLFHMVK